jgi:arsenate reductase
LYLKEGPQTSEIESVLTQLDLSPQALMRTKEPLFKELGLRAADVSDRDLIGAMVAHPALIERPVVIHGERAILGRPPENVLSLL